jgi:acyl carrier protein
MTLNVDSHESPSATERVVAGIWQGVLSCAEVKADDDFIQLGGDSILMMMVLFQVRESFGVDLPPGTLFESPKLRDFCALVDRAVKGGSRSEEICSR